MKKLKCQRLISSWLPLAVQSRDFLRPGGDSLPGSLIRTRLPSRIDIKHLAGSKVRFAQLVEVTLLDDGAL